MIKVSELKKGIEHCLDNGKRLIDDGQFLQKDKRYPSAIPFLILGYEEINKGVFLEYKFEKNEEVSDEEYRQIFEGRSHSKKNRMFFTITKERLEKMNDKEFLNLKTAVESKTSITWHNNRSDSILQVNNALPLVDKFNQIKKEFLYIDFTDNKWHSYKNRFKDPALDSLCTVLYYTALESYLKTKFYLDLDKMGFYRKVIKHNSEDEKRIFQNKYSVELEKIESFFKSPKWINARNMATKIIQSISNSK